MLPSHRSSPEQTRGPKVSFRERLYTFLIQPGSGPWARLYSFYMELLVVISIVMLLLSTFPSINTIPKWEKAHFYTETCISASFLLDMILKIFASPGGSYLRTWGALMDFLSIFPWFFDLTLDLLDKKRGMHPSGIGILRLIRFARFYRMAMGNFPEMRIFVRALKMSKVALLFLFLYVVGAGLLAAIILFYVETSGCVVDGVKKLWVLKDEPTVMCTFQNAGDAAWLVIVTMATVGYGDISPKTVIGKVIAALLMLISVVSFSLPVAIFGANLTELYLEQRLSKKEKSRSASPYVVSTTSLDQTVGGNADLSNSVDKMTTQVSSSLQKMSQLERRIEEIVEKLKAE